MVTTGEQVTARDFLAGLPVLGESELYDDVCDRLDATNDGERAGAIELALEGLYLARKIGKDTDGSGDRLWLRRRPRAASHAGYRDRVRRRPTRSRRRSTSPRRWTRSART